MKYTLRKEKESRKKKKLSVYKGGKLIDCCMNQEMKFFLKGPVPLSTLQRMDKLAVKL